MLIRDIATLRQHVRVNHQFDADFKQMGPLVKRVQRDYLRPVLGKPLLQKLETDFTSLAGAYATVLSQCQEALAVLAMHAWIRVAQMSLDDTGAHVHVDENHKTPYRWQFGDVREEYLLMGLASLDELYEVLEENRDALAEWKNSAAESLYNSSILRTADDFSRWYAINDSRMTFLDLKPAIRRAEELVVKPRIGEAFYAELVAAQLPQAGSEESESDSSGDAQSVDELRAQVLDKLRGALAHLAIADSKEVIWRQVNGALLSSRIDRNSEEQGSSGSSGRLTLDDVRVVRQNARDEGMGLLAQAHGFLDRNADSFPTYKDGPGYRPTGNQELGIEDRIHNTDGIVML